jgi:hypothetical protein
LASSSRPWPASPLRRRRPPKRGLDSSVRSAFSRASVRPAQYRGRQSSSLRRASFPTLSRPFGKETACEAARGVAHCTLRTL